MQSSKDRDVPKGERMYVGMSGESKVVWCML